METLEKNVATPTAVKPLQGAEFIIKESNSADVFIPEELNEEQVMIGKMCADFVDAEIMPILDRIDSQEEGLMVSLLD